MRILILTQWFDPEPFLKGLPLAKALQDRGHEVEVLTGFPNYPGGKVYPGYRIRLYERELMEGIPVHRVPIYPSHDRSGFRRILNHMSFALSSFLIGAVVVKKPDIIYVCQLVTLGFTSALLKLIHGCPVVYDIQDLWPDSVTDSGMIGNAYVLKVLNSWCDIVYWHASHLITLSPGMREELIVRGVRSDRVSVIYNWCDESHIMPAPRDDRLASELGLAGDFVVMYAGNIGLMQGLNTILDAAQLLVNREPRIKFVFVGGGVERDRLKADAAKRKLSNIIFLDRQPVSAMGRILALADVLLVHLKDTPLFRITLPQKIQAYLATAKPILLCVRGDAAEIIRNSAAGVVAEPENPASIVEKLLELFCVSEGERRQMGIRGRSYYEKVMSISVGVGRFEEVFNKMLANRA